MKNKKFDHEVGNMSPTVENMQKPESSFAEGQMSDTLNYIERQDKHAMQACKDLKSQAYKGRYS